MTADQGPSNRIGLQRRLAAIFVADFVGFSRLVAEDEETTVRILKAHRAIIDGIIELHAGRIFGTAGDSVIAEFPSPVEAVRCAIEIQEALRTRNQSLPQTHTMMLRIGINLGDVVVRGQDLLGDAVNIAARLQSIAEPGGICISAGVHEQIEGKLNLRFASMGAQSLKNIPRAVEAYQFIAGASAEPGAAPRRVPPTGTRSRVPLWAVGVVCGIALLSGAGWLVFEGGPLNQPPQIVAPTERPIAQDRFWLDGTWAVFVSFDDTALSPNFCEDADPHCRTFVVSGVSADGDFECLWGYQGRHLAPAHATVAGRSVHLITGARSVVDAQLRPDGILKGTLTSKRGNQFVVTLRKLHS